jgi:SOS-response transcriptional repressor LexA
VRSFELDDKDAVVRAVARIAKYLVGKEKQQDVRGDTRWFDRDDAGAPSRPAQPTLTVVDGGAGDPGPAAAPADAPRAPLRLVEPTPAERYVSCVPIMPLKAAAGTFGEAQTIDVDGWNWVEIETRHRLRPGMFVAQVVGRSMEPMIPDGSWCLFRAPVDGTRQGKAVLVQLRDALDPETGERFTVKRYESEKARVDDSWRHARITLKPTNAEFEPIVLEDADDGALEVVAEFVAVVGRGELTRT